MTTDAIITPRDNATWSAGYPRWLTIISDLQGPVWRAVDPVSACALALTFVKLPLALAMFLAATSGWLPVLALLVAVAIVVDTFDGILFRRSNLGRNARLVASRAVFDAHTDRIMMIAALSPLLVLHGFSVAIFTVFAAREVVLAALLARPFYLHGTLYRPNLPSRVASALMGATTVAYCLGYPAVTVLVSLFVPTAMYGIVLYIRRPRLAADQSV